MKLLKTASNNKYKFSEEIFLKNTLVLPGNWMLIKGLRFVNPMLPVLIISTSIFLSEIYFYFF